MTLMELLGRRYSCRKYLDRPVERETLIACVEAARQSPSACNSQRWLFIVVDEPKKKELVARAVYDEEWKINRHAAHTPAFIVMLKEPMEKMSRFQQHTVGKGTYWDVDMGIAVQTLCLAAVEQGLDTIMMGECDQEMMRAALDIPDGREIALTVGIGYSADDKPQKTPRKELGDILRFNSYRQ